MKDELHIIKNKILDYYPFKENKEGELLCDLKDGSKLVFVFSQKGKSIDLFLRRVLPFLGYKDTGLVYSFSFDNKEDIQILNEYIKNRLIN